MSTTPVTALFLDIGGVLGTNGWDRGMRKKAADKFGLDFAEMDERHHLTFDTYEEGKLSLDEYLARVIFCEPRSFTREEFKQFMFSQSQPYQNVIDLIGSIKVHYRLKIAVVSNEGRELTVYRIKKFGLDRFVDFFISSCFVHIRKPDEDIWRLALDVAQVAPQQVIYIEDRPLFVEVAQGLGIRGLHHLNYDTTEKFLSQAGLSL
jgi:putative hydrolase of the HAD superfamily